MSRSPLTVPLSIGDSLTQSEVEERFGTDFGYQFRGITYRNPDSGKYIIIMTNEGEAYNDQIDDGPTFTFEGEGLPENGDQSETVANRALLDAEEETLPIYLFTSTEGEDEYHYGGLIEVIDSEYISDGERMVYRFQFQKLGISTWEEYVEQGQKIERRSADEPRLETEERDYRETRSRARSSQFTRRVKEIYNNRCAACGVRRMSPEGSPEVDSAHIYPVAEGGTDDLRNGIALCKTHHWAFDNGWFSISDDRQIIINTSIEREPPETVAALEGEKLVDPEEPDFAPHPKFLSAHRKLWGIEK